MTKIPPYERFLTLIKKTDGCWEWTGNRDRCGYGQFSVTSHDLVSAHKYSYLIFRGTVSYGYVVMHRCDNPGCVNPEHLKLGTPADNSRDMVEKGRSADRNGLKNPNAKLTQNQINEMLRLGKVKGFDKIYSKKYGVHRTTIYRMFYRYS